MYMCRTHIASNYPVLVTPPRAHARRISASQDLGRPHSPCRLPHCLHTSIGAFPMFLVYSQVSTISFSAPFSVQQLTTQLSCPGSARPHNDPGSDSSMYMQCIDIASNSPVLVTPPRPHAHQLSASQDLGRPLPPRRLLRCPHTPKRTFSRSSAYPEVSTISFSMLFGSQ